MCSLSRSLLTAIIIGLALEASCDGGAKPIEHKEYKNRYYVTTIDKFKQNILCTQEIKIKGNGVDDTFTEQCVDDLSVMNTDELLVIGNPKTDPFSFVCFGDTTNVVVSIKKGTCMMRMYTEDNPTDPTSKGVTPIAMQEQVCVGLQARVITMIKEYQTNGNKGEDDKNGSGQQNGDESKLSSKYNVVVRPYTKNEKCMQEIEIDGNGVEDVFKGPCVDDLEIKNTPEVMAVGNPEKNPFSLFSNKMKTLIIVKDDKCKEKNYKTANGLTTSSTPSELNEKECEEIKKKIKQLFMKKQPEKGDKKLSSKFVVTTDKTVRRGKCIQETKISGNGVEDSFKGPCVDDLEIINEQEVLVVGDPDKNPGQATLYSEKSNTLVILKDGLCDERSYKTVNGQTTSSSKELDVNQCDDIEAKIKKQLQKRDMNEDEKLCSKFEVSTSKSERRGKCIQEIKISGNGVEDNFRGPCVDDLEIINEKEGLVIGNPDKNPFSLYSDKYSTLVILKDGLCNERSYETVNWKTTSSSKELDAEECDEIEEKIKTQLQKRKMSNGGSEKEESPFVVTTDKSERKGKCFQNIKITGNGIDDSFRGPCVDDLEVIKKKSILVVGDPEKTPFSFFSEKSNTLVTVKDSLCKERTYTTVNGKTTSTSRDLNDKECEEVEDKIANEWEKKRKGGDDEEEKIKYTVTTNKSERRGKCFQNIKINGNGVDDTFRGPCVDNLVTIQSGVLVIGDPVKDPFCLFSNKPNSLVIFKDDTCTESTYKTVDGKTTSSTEELDDDKCDKIEKQIREELFKEKKEKSKTEKGKGGKKFTKFQIYKEIANRRGKCFQEIRIEGNGVKDIFKGPCSFDFKIANEETFLLLGYPENDPFSVYTTNLNTLLIVKDGLCQRRTYTTEGDKTTSTSETLDEDECEAIESTVEQIMSDY